MKYNECAGKVLFIAENPDMRVWKMATALNAKGWEVYLAYDINTLESVFNLPMTPFKEAFSLTTLAGFSYIENYFDVIHCHNEPDLWTVYASALTRKSKTPQPSQAKAR